jgi:hypothetical protein
MFVKPLLKVSSIACAICLSSFSMTLTRTAAGDRPGGRHRSGRMGLCNGWCVDKPRSNA